MIPYGRQEVTQEDIEAVCEVLQSDFLTQGPGVPRFEANIAEICDVPFCVAVNSATSALHIACIALELGPGDILWTSPNSFVASSNCALYCRAAVDFVDIDPITHNMSLTALKLKLQLAREKGKLPKIVIPVHFAGEPCDMPEIYALSQEYGFKIIEDASHAIGARVADSPVGSCKYSDITVFSFHPVKIITSGEGGMLTTQSEFLSARLQMLRSHGITRDPSMMSGNADGGWYYEQLILGLNYRMTDIQAALGDSQLKRLQTYIQARHDVASQYDVKLRDLPLIRPVRNPENLSALHLYVVGIDSSKTKVSRKTVFDALRLAGVGVNVHYIPIHLQPYYRNLGFKKGDFPNAEAYYNNAISLPMYPTLSCEQQKYVVDMLKQVLV